MNFKEQIQAILPHISEPGRYIGGEHNITVKTAAEFDFRIALAFPDTYQIGMSHLGIKILYRILNDLPDIFCERVFSPWPDMAAALKAKELPLFTLESWHPVDQCDLFAITIPYEMSYTNVLNLIKLSHIPLRSADRGEAAPLVIGGGACCANPEPLADFFDIFLIGDGEEALPEIVAAIRAGKAQGKSRREILRALTAITGVYIPAFYHFEYDGPRIRQVTVSDGAPAQVTKRVLTDFDKSPNPDRFLVPNIEIIHDRAVVEIMRGCLRGCRFCQAGNYYRPQRSRSPQTILDCTCNLLTTSGFNEVSYNSLSVSDYSELEPLIDQATGAFHPANIAVSLPSMRMDSFSIHLAEKLSAGRKPSLTFAPEAGSQRLRDVINKHINEEQIFATIAHLVGAGWKKAKLYFMIDLPTETDEDVIAISDLCRRLLAHVRHDLGVRGFQLTVNISNFVPKAQTPFQWASQSPLAQVVARQQLIIGNYRGQIRWSDSQLSILEGAFSRGDRRLGQVVEAALKEGCTFDTWTVHFDAQKWNRAFEACGLNPHDLSTQVRTFDEILPWQHINIGISHEYLRSEYEQAQLGKTTPSCIDSGCQSCGLEETCELIAKVEATLPVASAGQAPQLNRPPITSNAVMKLRMQYDKKGLIRYVSHLSLLRIFYRAIARAELPVTFSQGFSPHPKVAFNTTLPVGVESECELIDISFSRRMDPEGVRQRLNRELPKGLHVNICHSLPPRAAAITNSIRSYLYEVSFTGASEQQEAILSCWRTQVAALPLTEPVVITIIRKKRERQLNLTEYLLRASIVESPEGSKLLLRIAANEGKTVKPGLLLEHIFGVAADQQHLILATRKSINLHE